MWCTNQRSMERRRKNISRIWRNGSLIALAVGICITFLPEIKCQKVEYRSPLVSNNKDNKTNLDIIQRLIQCHNCKVSDLNNSESVKETITSIKDEESNAIDDDESRVKVSVDDSLVDDLLEVASIISEDFLRKSNYITQNNETKLEEELIHYMDDIFRKDNYEIIRGIKIERSNEVNALPRSTRGISAEDLSFNGKIFKKFGEYARSHVLRVNVPETARFFGFKSFGLKKLLLPLILGVQVVKTILVAMFLPSLLGSFGKIVGKGLSQLSSTSGQASFGPGGLSAVGSQGYEKDVEPDGYTSDAEGTYNYPSYAHEDTNELSDIAMSRYGPGGAKVTYLPSKSGNYYKGQGQSQDHFKLFHKIPPSSMLLSNYDPFYSPLLSRLDGVFARLGLGGTEGPQLGASGAVTQEHLKLEACREQLICQMYSSPAKYAPYSNLVSAQLSRELNELRRPTSDNPEILRFFRYMRAARTGQDGAACIQKLCKVTNQPTPAHTMLAAYHDINKLVTARRL